MLRCRPCAPRLAFVRVDRGRGYSGTPLPRKLGIRPGSRVLLVGAPDGFVEARSASCPTSTCTGGPAASPYDVVLAFAPDLRSLERAVPSRPAAG